MICPFRTIELKSAPERLHDTGDLRPHLDGRDSLKRASRNDRPFDRSNSHLGGREVEARGFARRPDPSAGSTAAIDPANQFDESLCARHRNALAGLDRLQGSEA
jgi:hypothetical protein